LRAKLETYLGEEYDGDLEWFNREADMNILVDLVITSGGVSIGK
jgi:molybdopterin biosynthesis enzyme